MDFSRHLFYYVKGCESFLVSLETNMTFSKCRETVFNHSTSSIGSFFILGDKHSRFFYKVGSFSAEFPERYFRQFTWSVCILTSRNPFKKVPISYRPQKLPHARDLKKNTGMLIDSSGTKTASKQTASNVNTLSHLYLLQSSFFTHKRRCDSYSGAFTSKFSLLERLWWLRWWW